MSAEAHAGEGGCKARRRSARGNDQPYPEIIVMSQTIGKAHTSAPSPAQPGARPPRKDKEQAEYQRRLRAAGIKEDECPENMDAFRLQLARQIAMFVNKWHGCPERICQRNRGCMAPDIHCANVPRPTPEECARDWPKVQFEVRTALNKILAERAVEVEAYEEEELRRVLAKRRQGKPAEG